MLWVRGQFWAAEVLMIINMFNLTMLYFRHSTYPRLIHIPIVSAPLAWTYVATLWCGAAAVNARNLPARIVANLFIWGILVLGAFFILTFKDYTIGLELAVLSLGTLWDANLKIYVLLTSSSAGSRTTVHQGYRFSVDIRLRHHGLSGYPVHCSGHSWTHWRCQDKTKWYCFGRSRTGSIAWRPLSSWFLCKYSFDETDKWKCGGRTSIDHSFPEVSTVWNKCSHNWLVDTVDSAFRHDRAKVSRQLRGRLECSSYLYNFNMHHLYHITPIRPQRQPTSLHRHPLIRPITQHISQYFLQLGSDQSWRPAKGVETIDMRPQNTANSTIQTFAALQSSSGAIGVYIFGE